MDLHSILLSLIGSSDVEELCNPVNIFMPLRESSSINIVITSSFFCLKHYLLRSEGYRFFLILSTSPMMLRNGSKGVIRKAVTELAQYPKPGEKLHGFTLVRSKHVPELELTALHLQHDKTGADYLHVAREDKNNVFSIGFKTNPPDDTGVPHILEHTTLCGSEK